MKRAVLKFETHRSVPGGKSCNYIDNRNGNAYWLSCIPCNSAADTRDGYTWELEVFLCEHGCLVGLQTFKYKLKECPSDRTLSLAAYAVCDTVTEAYEPDAL